MYGLKFVARSQGQIALALAFLCLSQNAFAWRTLSLEFDELNADSVKLKKFKTQIQQVDTKALALNVNAVGLTFPDQKLTFKNLQFSCRELLLDNFALDCRKGALTLIQQDKMLKIPDYHLQVGAEQVAFHSDLLQWGHSKVALDLKGTIDNWQLNAKGQKFLFKDIEPFLKKAELTAKKGHFDFEIKADGKSEQLKQADVHWLVRDAEINSKDGRYACEKLSLDNYLTVHESREGWIWKAHQLMKAGAVYAEPLLVQAKPKQAINLDSAGLVNFAKAKLQLDHLQIAHPQIASLQAHGLVNLNHLTPLPQLNLSLAVKNLAAFSELYLKPFQVGTQAEGLIFKGELDLRAAMTAGRLEALAMDSSAFSVIDATERVAIDQASFHWRWQSTKHFKEQGRLKWKSLKLWQVPFSSAELLFNISDNKVELQTHELPVLGGQFQINDFSYLVRPNSEPELHFSGGLKNISLANLSSALALTPLKGELNGSIPGITYRRGQLKLQGELKILIFDGEIKVKDLILADLLGGLPSLQANVQVEKIDLLQLTDKLKFGSIEGFLSGYINNLILEDWKPVSFYAWLGTPDDDRSRHRISQRAVDSIASIGGGGASDAVSRGLLGLFDSFGYDKLGLGCYLHQGVCQLMGLEAAPQGYVIVKGGGLPKIDVIGFNPRIDWKVLLERVARVNEPDTMIVN